MSQTCWQPIKSCSQLVDRYVIMHAETDFAVCAHCRSGDIHNTELRAGYVHVMNSYISGSHPLKKCAFSSYRVLTVCSAVAFSCGGHCACGHHRHLVPPLRHGRAILVQRRAAHAQLKGLFGMPLATPQCLTGAAFKLTGMSNQLCGHGRLAVETGCTRRQSQCEGVLLCGARASWGHCQPSWASLPNSGKARQWGGMQFNQRFHISIHQRQGRNLDVHLKGHTLLAHDTLETLQLH